MFSWIIRLLMIAVLFVMARATRQKVTGWVRWPVFAIVILIIIIQGNWSHLINKMMPFETRPGRIEYNVEVVNDNQYEKLVSTLVGKIEGIDPAAAPLTMRLASTEKAAGLKHIEYFRRAGIRSYEGPSTCLQCHEWMDVPDDNGQYRKVRLREDLTHSVHFTFAPKMGFSTYGYNGEKVENFPLGKMDRACGIPGTFTWTGWAELIPTAHGDTLSEGCGQCHIVGQYGPISGAMMPGYKATDAEWDATDCLVCHATEYDMNFRQVVRDPNGKTRWDHDRRLVSAMSVRRPTDNECLRCHQHNLGGDTYHGNTAVLAAGRKHPRIAHTGAKRGTPFGVDWDVHAKAGLECLDCHVSRGHKIARGQRGVDLVANDLPDVEISCENCHGNEPHSAGDYANVYNVHTERIACETCHIHRLHPDNLTFRDWANPSFHENAGIWGPSDAPYDGEPGGGIVYKWFNGNGTFMANALGDHPDKTGKYFALNLKPNPLWPESENYDYKAEYERLFRPIAQQGTSKIWPFKRLQAVMYEDLNNQGPYGGMILPFDYLTYYTTGDPVASVKAATDKPIMRMMYGSLFKMYMMDRFMNYMGIDGWNTNFDIERIAATPMRNEGNLMINHAIQKEGRACSECHNPNGILDFDALGYPPDYAEELRELEL